MGTLAFGDRGGRKTQLPLPVATLEADARGTVGNDLGGAGGFYDFRPTLRRVVSVILFAVCVGSIGVVTSCNDQKSGACVSGSGITEHCTNDTSEAECSIVSGTLHANKTCAQIGW